MLNTKNILIVDTDRHFLATLANQLKINAFNVDCVNDVTSASTMVKEKRYHIALIEVNLVNPQDSNDWSGIDLAENLSHHTRVIMMSNKPSVEMIRTALATRINGTAPAYDLIKKSARIESIITTIQRVLNAVTEYSATPQSISTQARLHPRSTNRFALDQDQHLAIIDGECREIIDREFRLLNFFMDHAGAVITRKDIVTRVIGDHYNELADNNRVNNIISRLRRAIEPLPDRPQFIVTRWGSGWIFYPHGEAQNN